MIQKKTFHIISLGCAKNSVDSESIATLLIQAGYTPLLEPDQAQYLIVNTCGFIKSARNESLHILENVAQHKENGQYLIAAGCLTERMKEGISLEIPKLDAVFGTRRWMDVLHVIQQIRRRGSIQETYYHFPDTLIDNALSAAVPRVAIQGASSYLKIADGCRHRCSFCAIPLIKGTKKSRPMDQIIEDARYLQKNGVKEINLIAQDSTDYGFDLGVKEGLAKLLEKLVPVIPDVPWLRILYAYPGNLSPRLIDTIAGSKQILNYIDIPLQHAHPDILRSMQRPANMEWMHKTLRELREKMPDIALRTTFIVGYPGETEQAYQVLLDFVKEIEFDHLGAFTYSFEVGTPAEPLGDPVPMDVKEERIEGLMLLQEEIAAKRNRRLVNSILPVLVEGSSEGISVGRTYRDAPEIDGLTFIDSELTVGEIYEVKITGSMVHDLLATI